LTSFLMFAGFTCISVASLKKNCRRFVRLLVVVVVVVVAVVVAVVMAGVLVVIVMIGEVEFDDVGNQ
jgi:hypothetical protein